MARVLANGLKVWFSSNLDPTTLQPTTTYAIYRLTCLTGSFNSGADSRSTQTIDTFDCGQLKIEGIKTFGDVSVTVIMDDNMTDQNIFTTEANLEPLNSLFYCATYGENTPAPVVDAQSGIITPPPNIVSGTFQGKITSLEVQASAGANFVQYALTIARDTAYKINK